MCRDCWAQVPPEMQREVYRTVKLRDMSGCDETWAPWWRAQGRATHHVAMERDRRAGLPPDPRGAKYLARELAFADSLERQQEGLGEG